VSRREVAKARRTQLVSTYGVGSLFPSEDESFMICGLDDWPTGQRSAEVSEPRLARSLGVATFRSPASGLPRGDVPVVRFPDYHSCAKCGSLKLRWQFCNDTSSECDKCGRRITPSRFVACCRRGHIEDFPYFRWVHADTERSSGGKHELTITTQGRSSSLSDVVIGCSCGVTPVSMAGSFSSKGVGRCQGRRPWLPEAENEPCDETLRALQRGSSNVWFPIVRSALSIPPWSDRAYALARKHWDLFNSMSVEKLQSTIEDLPLKKNNVTAEMVLEAVLDLRGERAAAHANTDEELRREEYRALVVGHPENENSPHAQFVCSSVDLDSSLRVASVVSQLSKVSRLREVRALESFSRIVPWTPGMETDRKGRLSVGQPPWLPAIEVLGEGIFIRLDEEELARWEATEFARDRAGAIETARDAQADAYGLPAAEPLAPRDLLLHTFAHAVLNELSLDAGYPAASLRERLYTGRDEAGVLIYTASADSAGSLGGLAAQGQAELFDAVVMSALRRARWCSADPVCVESRAGGFGGLNLAACHACVLLPETSCERFNSVLDRAVLIGLPNGPEKGFLSHLT
jgi:hypothetical protein